MKRVASIGECMIELRHTDARTLKLGFGGDTLNTAVYLARVGQAAGIRVDYVTALGNDSYSNDMLAAWQAEGVGTELVARLAGRLPGLYIIRTDDRGERSFTYFRSAAAAREVLRNGRAALLADRLAGYSCLYLSGITLSILDETQRRSLMDILDRLRSGGTQIAFDSNFRPVGWPNLDDARLWMTEALRRSSIALPTLDDEQRLFGDADADGLPWFDYYAADAKALGGADAFRKVKSLAWLTKLKGGAPSDIDEPIRVENVVKLGASRTAQVREAEL